MMYSARRLATVLAADVVGHSAGIGAGPGTLGHAANHRPLRTFGAYLKSFAAKLGR